MFKNRSKVAFVSAVIATLYVLYLSSYFFGDVPNDVNGGAEAVGAALAITLIMPHLIANFIAVIFNWIAFAMNKKWAIIVALVLYIVAGILFPLYFFFDLPSITLSAVAISKIGKIYKREV